MPVSLSNNLLRLVDLSPFLRNDNVASSPVNQKAGPHHIFRDPVYGWRCYIEAINDTLITAPFDYQTGPALATAPIAQGPWTRETGHIITPNSGAWEQGEISPSSIDWDAANNRWVIWYHGGHNLGPRQVGVLYSTDGFTGKALTRGNSGNPILAPGTGGSSDDQDVSDFKVVKKADGTYVAFYCGRQSGGPSNGTIHKATASDPENWTKQGEVIPEGSGWNATGHYPSQVWVDPEGRWHMFTGNGDTGQGAIGYFYSDDEGDTWTAYGSNPVASGSGTTTASDEHIGDVTQVAPDGDVLVVSSGIYSSAFTNPPLRGQGLWITPARVATPTRTAKFFLPTTGSQTQTSVSGSSVLSVSTGAIIGRFRAFRLTRSTQYREIYTENATFNIEVYVRIEGGAGANAGKLGVEIRTPTGQTLVVSNAQVDDGLWHSFMVRRKSGSSADVWIDGALVVSDSTVVNTNATATFKAVGNWHSSAAVADEPALCTISDLITLTGAVPTWEEAVALIANRANVPSGATIQVDFPASGTEQGNVVTVEGEEQLPTYYTVPVPFAPVASGLRF